MWLYVLDLHVVQTRELAQGPELVDELVVDLVRRNPYLPAPEPDQVTIPIVDPDRDTVLPGQLHGSPHNVRVARMKAARHVGRRDVAHKLLVRPEAVRPEALAHVAVEIYVHVASLRSALLAFSL